VNHTRCLTWAASGLALGVAAVAHAQDAVVAEVLATESSLVVELVRTGGLPAVLAALGWLLGRGGIPLRVEPTRVVLELAPEDRALLGRVADALEGDERRRR